MLRRAALLAAVLAAGCGSDGERVSYQDDFSGECRWPSKRQPAYEIGCNGERYRIRITAPAVQPGRVVRLRLPRERRMRALSLEADAVAVSGPSAGGEAFHGVGCWTSAAGEPQRGYLFVVRPDGGAYIIKHDDRRYRQAFGLGRYSGKPRTARPGLGAGNHIKAECARNGDTAELALEVNGAQVATLRDESAGDFRAAGLYAFSGRPAVVFFDNFALRELD